MILLLCKPAMLLHTAPCCNTEPPAGTGFQPSGIPSVPWNLGKRDALGGVGIKAEERGVAFPEIEQLSSASCSAHPEKHELKVSWRGKHAQAAISLAT